MMNTDIFGDVDKSKYRQQKPVSGTPPKWVTDNEPSHDMPIRRLKPMASGGGPASSGPAMPDSKLQIGNVVMHERFGKGKVLNIEGAGPDKKAEIHFEVGGIKKLLLRFAKLDVLG